MTEMSKLALILMDFDIPFAVTKGVFDEPHIRYPEANNWTCDVISNDWSYGGSDGLLEIMGLVADDVDDDVEGWLTANVVASRIASDYFGMAIRFED